MFAHRMTTNMLRATGLVSALALIGCSDDPTDPGIANGTFTASVTGGVTATFSGAAIQGQAEVETGQQGWVVVLNDDATNPLTNSVFIALLGNRPPAGQYQVRNLIVDNTLLPGEWGAALLLGNGTTLSYSGLSLSGTVTITSSSAELVVGTYTIQVSGEDPVNPGTAVLATVTASFSAAGGAVNLPQLR